QADYDALPFAPQPFDLVVFNGPLHYAPDPASTLAAAHRMLAPAGTLAVMDSPMFVRDGDGRAMAAGMESRLASLLRGTLPPGADGADRFIQPGPGYLTFAAIDASAQSLGLRAEFIPSRGSIGWRLRRGRPCRSCGVDIFRRSTVRPYCARRKSTSSSGRRAESGCCSSSRRSAACGRSIP